VEYKQDVMQSFDKLAMPLFKDGRLLPNVFKSFKIDLREKEDESIANEGHAIMEGNKNIGKIIFEFKE